MREDGQHQTAALLPWLAKEFHLGDGARLIGLEAVLRHASFERSVPGHVKEGLQQSLPFLLHHLQAGAPVKILSRAMLFEAARGYYARHGTPEELQSWLGFELGCDRVQGQLAIARLLAEAPGMWEEGLGGPRRAVLTALMLTGRTPPPRTRPPNPPAPI